jgi:hypothetical protein
LDIYSSKNTYPDGVVHVDTSEMAKEESPFRKEIDLEEFITSDISAFCRVVLGDQYKHHTVNQDVTKRLRMAPRGRRIDIYIECENKDYIIELKNPISMTENRHAIGQLLDYGREFTDPKKEMLLITSKFDINTARTIDHYKLPIRYMLVNENHVLEYKGEVSNGA